MKQLNIGLIGLGRIGKVHLENLVYRIPEAKVLAVASLSNKNHSFARNLGVPTIYQQSAALFKDPDIAAVIICSPTDTHLSYIESAAKAGKHIFCEKPIEMTAAKIQRALRSVDKYGVKFQVGFNRRFDVNFRKVQELVKNGKIGAPHILKITSRDPAPPSKEYAKSSGGLFLDMTIHDFDMARNIVGSEVVEVFAKGAVLVDKAIGEAGDIDTAIVTLKFANGCIGVIDNSRKAVYGYDQRIEIFGSKGMSLIGNNTLDTQVLYDKNGGHTARPLHFFMDRYTESFCEEMRAFIQAVQKDKPVPVNGIDALMATKIAVAANQSLKRNRPVNVK